MTYKDELKISGLILGILLLGAFFMFHVSKSEAGTSSLSSYPCSNITVTNATVGNQASTQILAASSRRAWARIEQPINATNTVAIAIGGSSATIGQGFELTQATSTSPVVQFDFGLNADLPYTGVVQARTDAGSSTVLVTQCVY